MASKKAVVISSRFRITQTSAPAATTTSASGSTAASAGSATTVFDRSRRYRVAGYPDPFPSVTSILDVINKPGLHYWKHRTSMNSIRSLLNATSPAELAEKDKTSYGQWVDDAVAQASSEPQRIGTSAATFGTNTHSLIEKLLCDPTAEVPESHRIVMANFQAWREASGLQLLAETDDFVLEQMKEIEPEPVYNLPTEQDDAASTAIKKRKRTSLQPITPKGLNGTEVIVCSPTYGYAGCLDAVAVRTRPDGTKSLVILDWKTSNMLTMENALQVAAYAKAFEETFGERVDEAWVVRFDKGIANSSKPAASSSWQKKKKAGAGGGSSDAEASLASNSSQNNSTVQYEAKQVHDLDATFKVFLDTLSMWRHMQQPSTAFFSHTNI